MGYFCKYVIHICILSYHMHIHTCRFRCMRSRDCGTGIAVKPKASEAGLRRNSWRPGPTVGRAQGLDSFNTNLVLPSGKPRCTSFYFKLWHLYYVALTCALGLGIVWNPSCMIPRFPGPYTSMCRSVALLCLIGLGRSRVISCHSRDIGYFRVE